MRLKPSSAVRGRRARIHFDAALGVLLERVALGQHRHHLLEFGIAEEGRRAAPEVQLLESARTGQQAADEIGLRLQRIQILGGALVMARDDLVAGAVEADLVAERNVHVNRQRRRRGQVAALGEAGRERLGIERLDEAIGGRI